MRKSVLVLVLAAIGGFTFVQPANAAEYETFVGCDDLAEEPIPSHACQIGDFPGAYFESDLETEYEVCVEFPDGVELCAEEQLAEAEALYVNSIFSEEAGDHLVSWYVEGAEVGSWVFRMDPPPAPPTPAPPPAPAPSPPAVTPVGPTVAPGPSRRCQKARRRVGALKRQLRKATGRKRKLRVRAKLRRARAMARRAC